MRAVTRTGAAGACLPKAFCLPNFNLKLKYLHRPQHSCNLCPPVLRTITQVPLLTPVCACRPAGRPLVLPVCSMQHCQALSFNLHACYSAAGDYCRCLHLLHNESAYATAASPHVTPPAHALHLHAIPYMDLHMLLPDCPRAHCSIVKVFSGSQACHSVAVDAAGAAYIWGRNDSGQCGTGSKTVVKAPGPLRISSGGGGGGTAKVVAASCGRAHTAVVTAGACVYVCDVDDVVSSSTE